jgi:hypothetical protein
MLKKLSYNLTLIRDLGTEPKELRAHEAINPNQLNSAKELHAKVFHSRGFVKDTDLIKQGRAIGEKEDPYQGHSQYFIVERSDGKKNRTVAASRLILADPLKGHQSFQTYHHQKLNSVAMAAIAKTKPEQCAEVSGLVKEPGENTIVTLMLYREMWRFSLKQKHELWLMSCDANLYKRLKLLFGNALIQAGEQSYFKGHEVIPVILEVPASLQQIKEIRHLNPVRQQLQQKLVKFFLKNPVTE